MALLPTEVVTAVTAVLAIAPGYVLANMLPALTKAVDAVFARLAPGETLVRAQLIGALLSVPGVIDVTLLAPAANVTSLVSSVALQIVTRGALALS